MYKRRHREQTCGHGGRGEGGVTWEDRAALPCPVFSLHAEFCQICDAGSDRSLVLTFQQGLLMKRGLQKHGHLINYAPDFQLQPHIHRPPVKTWWEHWSGPVVSHSTSLMGQTGERGSTPIPQHLRIGQASVSGLGDRAPRMGPFWQAYGCLCFCIHGNQGKQTQGGKEEGGWLFACLDPSGSRVMGTSVHVPSGVQA